MLAEISVSAGGKAGVASAPKDSSSTVITYAKYASLSYTTADIFGVSCAAICGVPSSPGPRHVGIDRRDRDSNCNKTKIQSPKHIKRRASSTTRPRKTGLQTVKSIGLHSGQRRNATKHAFLSQISHPFLISHFSTMPGNQR